MSTTELQVIDLVEPAPPPDPAVVWAHRAWGVATLILVDVLAGIVAALVGSNVFVIAALVSLVPLGTALHLALTRSEWAGVQ